MNRSQQTIVCGFPGIGKSHASQEHGWHDSDSSKFSWESPGVRHPDFPGNYIDHLKTLEGVVLVSTHAEVREALHKNDIPFILCYPMHGCKDEYLQRFRDRGSDEKFIELLDANWSEWVTELSTDSRACSKHSFDEGEYLSDAAFLIDVTY